MAANIARFIAAMPGAGKLGLAGVAASTMAGVAAPSSAITLDTGVSLGVLLGFSSIAITVIVLLSKIWISINDVNARLHSHASELQSVKEQIEKIEQKID